MTNLLGDLKSKLFEAYRLLKFNFKLRIQQRTYFLKYNNRDQCDINVGLIKVKFVTTDWFAKKWFYPRYGQGQMHEPNMTRALVSEMGEYGSHPVFFDVGSNLGYYSCVVGSKNANAQIESFEMHSKYAELQQESVELNELKNVTINTMAVGGENKTITGPKLITPNSGLSISSSIAEFSSREFKQITLSSFCGDKNLEIDVAKIDVEGAEMGVLEGMEKMLDGNKAMTLFVEIHPEKIKAFGHVAADVLNFLWSKRFDLSILPDHRDENAVVIPLLHNSDAVVLNTMVIARRA